MCVVCDHTVRQGRTTPPAMEKVALRATAVRSNAVAYLNMVQYVTFEDGFPDSLPSESGILILDSAWWTG